MLSVAKSGKSENGQIAVNSVEVKLISMRLPGYSYSNVSSACRRISTSGVGRISSADDGVISRTAGRRAAVFPRLEAIAGTFLSFAILQRSQRQFAVRRRALPARVIWRQPRRARRRHTF